MDNDGFVPRIPLPFLDLTNEIDETGARRRHRLLGPVRVLELLHVERGAVMSVDQLELPQNIVSEVCGFAGDDLQLPVRLCSGLGPVAMTFGLQ